MAGASIEIIIDDSMFQDAMDGLIERCEDMTPVMLDIGEMMVESVRENFLDQGRPEKWEPLAQSTALGIIGGKKGWTKRGRIKVGAERRLQDKMILIGKGNAGGLMGSFAYKAESDSVAIGTPKVYGAIQNFGGDAGRNHASHIPARPYLVAQDEDVEKIKEEITRYILGK